MDELSFEYWNKLAEQYLLINVFLGGFTIAITANFLVNKSTSRLDNVILRLATVSSGSFLIAVFATTKIILMTTEGYPLDTTLENINFPRVIWALTYFVGVTCLLAIVGLSGWTKSKNTGIFTTIVSLLALILFLVLSIG